MACHHPRIHGEQYHHWPLSQLRCCCLTHAVLLSCCLSCCDTFSSVPESLPCHNTASCIEQEKQILSTTKSGKKTAEGNNWFGWFYSSISKMQKTPGHCYRSNTEKCSSTLFEQRGWTRWPPVIPSNYNYSVMSLWEQTISIPLKLKFRNIHLTALQTIANYQQHPNALCTATYRGNCGRKNMCSCNESLLQSWLQGD